MLSPTPECTCAVKCSCDLYKSIQKKQEIEQVVCFLKGLGEVYGTVKSNILMMDPLPFINKAYGLVLQQEGQLQGSNIIDSKVLFNSSNQPNSQGNWSYNQEKGTAGFGRGRGNANSGRGDGTYGKGRGRGYTSKQCTYCNKFGHTVDQCYSKHGYPPIFKTREGSAINSLVIPEDDHNQNAIVPSVSHNPPHGNTSQSLQLAPDQLQQIISTLQQNTNRPPHSISQIHSTTTGEYSS